MKKDTFVSPLEDYVFKEIFGEPRNIDNTRAFLKTLLNIPEDEYDKLTVSNSLLNKVLKKGKSGVVDIKLTTKSGKILHVELQVRRRANTRSRVLYYGARLIGDQLKWGDDYNLLNQVISIVICDHVLLDEEDSYINMYELRNENNRSFTNLLKVIIIELPKLPETKDRSVWPWLKFLKCKSKEELKMLAKKYPELEKPVCYTKRMSLLEHIRDYQFHRNLAKVDERMLLEQMKIDGKAEGKAEGLAEGEAKGRTKGSEKLKMKFWI